MTTIQFLAEWALRSSVLIVSGALLLWALRVKDPSIRWAAWTAMLCASLAIPALTVALPKLPVVVMRAAPVRVEAPLEAPLRVHEPTLQPGRAISRSDVGVNRPVAVISKPFNWARAAVMVYVFVALAFLLRLSFGLAMSLRLLRRSRATGEATEGIEIRESDCVGAPVALGIVRPAIVLPGDWRGWDDAKLGAVLAHERSHIRRYDPAVQLLSAIHRALLWPTPLSWFLHRQIVPVAEEVCDDAGLAVTRDRTLYAEVLLDFMRRGVWGASWQGVPMARYGRADKRIHRILDGTVLSRGVTRWSLAAILTLGLPLACVVAAAYPEAAPPVQATTGPAAPVQTAGKPPTFDALPVKLSAQNPQPEKPQTGNVRPHFSYISTLTLLTGVSVAQETKNPPVEIKNTRVWEHRIGPEEAIHRNQQEMDELKQRPLGFANQSGQCLFEVIVSEKGAVESFELVKGSEPCEPHQQEAEAILRSRKYQPWLVDGVPARVKIQDGVNIYPPERWGPSVLFPEKVDRSTLEFQLERTTCYGPCPSYTVSIAGDGTVRYDGRASVAIPGHHTAHISPDAVTELIQQFRAADFLSALSKYQSNWTDYPTQTISLHINGQVKTVVDYFGEDVGLPLAISNLETAIDKAAGTKRWIEGNDERGSAELGVLGSTLRFVNL